MKRCEVCKKLTDNGDKRCPRCGSPFQYDPKVSPFSETRIGLILVALAIAGFIVAGKLPLQLPDPTVCSQTSYNRFKRIVVEYHSDVTNILAENYISSKDLTEIAMKKRTVEEMPVPACLETAKTDFVNYLNAIFYTAIPAAWDDYEYATTYAEQAVNTLNLLQQDLEEVKACLPNCQ